MLRAQRDWGETSGITERAGSSLQEWVWEADNVQGARVQHHVLKTQPGSTKRLPPWEARTRSAGAARRRVAAARWRGKAAWRRRTAGGGGGCTVCMHLYERAFLSDVGWRRSHPTFLDNRPPVGFNKLARGKSVLKMGHWTAETQYVLPFSVYP